jgi:glutaminyl-tRNA synthetase
MYEYAVKLIKKGKAFVCDLSPEEVGDYRGTLTEPGKDSPYRDRSVEENLQIFEDMRNGKYEDGAKTLRAKIDMSHTNIHMRDPALYRIRNATHHNTGDKWCIYPMYDFAHCIEDSIEGITHSICTLEFEIHRPLYDWILEEIEVECHPQQIEFARLNLEYTVMSKRKLLELVESNLVTGWDDPRMPTISGMRRRGYSPASIRNFCERIGVTKFNSMTEINLLEHCVREDLNENAPRAVAILDPLKVIVDNLPEGEVITIEAKDFPQHKETTKRPMTFTRELYIEREDFKEEANRKFFRLTPGKEVRFKYGFLLTCTNCVKDDDGNVIEVHCTYDPESKGGFAPDGRKVKGTIHWLSKEDAIEAEFRLYDRLFTVPNLDAEEGEYKDYLNDSSLSVVKGFVEPSQLEVEPSKSYQFERLGYFCADIDSTPQSPIFNRCVTLRESKNK